jgi:hypothetical protein
MAMHRRPRLTNQIKDGLAGMCGIVETILEAGGEGWAMECATGTPEDRPCGGCEECRNYQEADAACRWLRAFLATKENHR